MQAARPVGDDVEVGLVVHDELGPAVQAPVAGLDPGAVPGAGDLRQGDPRHRSARGQLWKPGRLLAGVARLQEGQGRHDRRAGEGDRGDEAAQLLGGQGGVQQGQPHPAVDLGDDQAGDAQFGQALEHVRGPPVASGGEGAGTLQPAGPGEEPGQGVLQHDLLFGESEFHGVSPQALASLGSRGMSSPRSAMMFFWICEVPPPMIRPRKYM